MPECCLLWKNILKDFIDEPLIVLSEGKVVTATASMHRLLGYLPGTLEGCAGHQLLQEMPPAAEDNIEIACVLIDSHGREIPAAASTYGESLLTIRPAGPDSPSRLVDDLERQTMRLKAIVDTAVDGIITIDEHGLITFVNIAVEKLFGYASEELLGRNVSILMPEPYHSQHDGYLNNYHETGERKIIGIGRTVEGRRKNGEIFPLELAVSESITRQGRFFTGIIHDITERVVAEEVLKRERALLKTILDYAPDGVLLMSPEAEVLTANPAASQIFGVEGAELVGRSLWQLIDRPDDGDSGDGLMPGRLREMMGRRSGGQSFPVEIFVADTPASAGPMYTAFVSDITERKRMEQTRLAKEAAERANAAKSEFLSRMSHELRTPLNAVIGYAQLMTMKYADPAILDSSTSILKAGRHLLSLINEVLDLASIDAGRFATSLEPVQIGPVINQALDLVTPMTHAEQIAIVWQDESCGGRSVLADRQRLLQVCINLLSNAVKYNRTGGTVTVACGDSPDSLMRLTIRDTGLGIPMADRDRLFQPFERLGQSHIEGSGLGLALSRRFVELMEGRLELLESGADGSCFAVDLKPSSLPSHRVEPAVREDRQNAAATFDREVQILYIEDNTSNMKLMELILAEWNGVTMIPAVQGRIGLELARTRIPDLILLDLHLSDMHGEQVLRLLRSDPATREIPIVVVSADATSSQIQRLRDLGAENFVTKPIDIALFSRVVSDLLKQSR